MNYSEYQESGMPDLPTVPEFDPYAPNRAKSKKASLKSLYNFKSQYYHNIGFPVDRRDFDITPIEIIFEANEFTRDDVVSQISIINDEINEADEFFVVVLEIVDAVNPAIVDLSVQNASLCQIMDNDRKWKLSEGACMSRYLCAYFPPFSDIFSVFFLEESHSDFFIHSHQNRF